ncbi:MAG: histidine phosphatase family protein [Bacteroidetes bacterium]|nr:histidine phosphatase family protein [Bacteroidota bacterium]MBS1633671.1 histidine phosphatase family protein [Bacteroidota bacterium]
MKSLLLIRHAKSSWDDKTMNDFDRPLNDRGKRDALKMAKRLLDKDFQINAFISSPAKRAAKTAKIFAGEFGIEKEDIVYKTELYLAPAEIFFDIVRKTSDELNCICLFSHNPGITEFANELTEVRIDSIPTCGIYAVHAQIIHWSDFKVAKKKFGFFDYPAA